MKKRPASYRAIFAIPAAIAAATLIGLVIGLTGDGMPDFLAWLLVGLAPLTIAAVLLRRSPNASSTHKERRSQ